MGHAVMWQGRVVLRRPRDGKPFIVSDLSRKEIIGDEKFAVLICGAHTFVLGCAGLVFLGCGLVQLGTVIWRAKANWYAVAVNATNYLMQTHPIAIMRSFGLPGLYRVKSWTKFIVPSAVDRDQSLQRAA